MATTNIKTSEVEGLGRQLEQWSGSLDSIRSQMKSRVDFLRSSWNDPQYQVFLVQVDAMAKQLDAAVNLLKSQGKNLQIVARAQEEVARQNQNTLRS
jgi:uncharacterized protein YukE